MDRVFIGTSGWIYKDWAGSFYPQDCREHLEYYARQFNSVEVNASFYRLQKPEVMQAWYRRTPAHFRFAVKGSRFITHMKRLKVERNSIQVFFARARLLKEKCGPILWQLRPDFQFDLERLHSFLKIVPKRFRHAVEFRHPSWYEHEETFELLRQHRAAHVWLSSQQMPANFTVTTDFVYVRFHGLAGGAAHDYSHEELLPWARQCRRGIAAGLEVHAYFNNDANTRAPGNATMLREMIAVRKPAQQRVA